jgi:dedicator of cytokinesis protein 3
LHRYPFATPAERREELYKEAIELFVKSHDWEAAVALCEELRQRYQRQIFNYNLLSKLLHEQAGFFEKIATVDRFYPSHFRVGFYGQQFPPEYRNKQYVYRGDALESIIDFSNRMKSKFSGVKTLPSKTQPSADQFESWDTRWMQISKLTPSTSAEMVGEQPKFNTLMHPRVLKYYQNNDIDVFYYTRVFRKKKKKGDNEFLDLWVSKQFLRTGEVSRVDSERCTNSVICFDG